MENTNLTVTPTVDNIWKFTIKTFRNRYPRDWAISELTPGGIEKGPLGNSPKSNLVIKVNA